MFFLCVSVCMSMSLCVCEEETVKERYYPFPLQFLCIYYSAICGLMCNKNTGCIFSEIIALPFWKHANDLNCVLLDNETNNCKKLVKYIHDIEKV